MWCLELESNQRPPDFQSSTLPAELSKHMVAHLGTAPSEPIDKSFTDSTASLTGYCATNGMPGEIRTHENFMLA